MYLLSRVVAYAAAFILGTSVVVTMPILATNPANALYRMSGTLYYAHTFPEFQYAVNDCNDAPKTIVLGADIFEPTEKVVTSCDLRIDLSGYNLSVEKVVIGVGTTLEITGPTDGYVGTLTADPSENNGTGISTANATLTVTGGRVIAYGANMYSAIGGDYDRNDAGTLNVHGGTVIAFGHKGGYGTAIGGAWWGGNGGVVNVTGGSVYAESAAIYGTAIGGAGGFSTVPAGAGGSVTVTGGTLISVASGASSVAIGGGAIETGEIANAGGAKITIGANGTIVASSPYNAIGGGRDHSSSSTETGNFGELNVDGTLYLPTGRMIVKDSQSGPEVIVGQSGRILGDRSDPTTGATIIGTGQISNDGVIALDPPPTMVTGNNRLITFDTGDPAVRIFAPSFDTGYRALPLLPADTEWNTSGDGLGTWFTESTSTTGSGTIPLYAAFTTTIEASKEPADLTAIAGQPYAFPVTVSDHGVVPLNPQQTIDYTSPDCTIVGADIFEIAVECTIIATAVINGTPVSTSFTIDVVAGLVHELAITPSATTVLQG